MPHRREMSFTHLLHQSPPPPPNAVQLPSLSSLLPWPQSPNSPASRGGERSPPSQNEHNVIDLTGDTSPPSASTNHLPTTMPRQSEEPARKRRRVSQDPSLFETSQARQSETTTQTSQNTQHTSQYTTQQTTQQSLPAAFIDIDDDEESSEEADQIDLTTVEDQADLRKIQEEQKRQREAKKQRDRLQKESLTAQAPEEGPTSLTNLSCIICMDNVTNLTATHCGHLFCHECLFQALVAGEKDSENGKGAKCPVCRTSVHRVQKSNQKLPQMIALEIKKRKKSDTAKGKERADNPAFA